MMMGRMKSDQNRVRTKGRRVRYIDTFWIREDGEMESGYISRPNMNHGGGDPCPSCETDAPAIYRAVSEDSGTTRIR